MLRKVLLFALTAGVFSIFTASAATSPFTDDHKNVWEFTGSESARTITRVTPAEMAVVVPNALGTVTALGPDAVQAGSVPFKFTVPYTVTAIDSHAFDSATNLNNIFVALDNSSFKSDSYYRLLSKDGTKLIRSPLSVPVTAATVPSSVKEIAEHAFYACSTLLDMTVSGSVTNIGTEAFAQTEITNFVFKGLPPEMVGTDAFPVGAYVTWEDDYEAEWTAALDAVGRWHGLVSKETPSAVYDIAYELKGGENAPSNPTEYTGADEISLADPARTGYVFTGWIPTNAIPVGSYGPKAFTANWEVVTYSVSYELNGGENAEANPTNYTVEDAFTLTDPSRVGYTFKGWTPTNTIPAGTIGPLVFNAFFIPNAYTVIFSGSPATETAMEAMALAYDVETNLSANTFVLEGRSFVCWTNTTDNKTYEDNAPVSNLTADVNGMYELQAVWTGNVYEVRFEPGEGGSGSMAPITMTYGEPKALPPNEFQRVDYTFNGWLTNGVSSVVYVDKAEVISLATGGVFTLTADWRLAGNTYSVDYHANNGTSAIEHEVYACSVETNLLGATKFSRSGYSFVYWTNNVGTAYQPNQTVVNLAQADETCDLYACWTNNVYGITFRVDGVETVTNAVYAKPFEFGTVAKTGYVFQGWTNAAQHVLIPAGESNHDFIGAQEFEAVFSPNAYRVAFNGAGATETAMEAMALTYDVETNLSANTFVLEGRSFVCWTNTTDNKTYEDEALVSNLIATAGDTYALAAVWSNNVYTITFDERGGSDVMNITAEYAEPIVLPSSTKTGYTFNGWTNAETEVVVGAEYTIPASDTAFAAKWTLNQYDVILITADGTPVTNKVDFGTLYTLGASEKTGYTFNGWTNATYTTPVSSYTVCEGGDTFYPVFTANRYDFVFKTNGVEYTTLAQTFDMPTAAPADLEETGKGFVAWQTNGVDFVFGEIWKQTNGLELAAYFTNNVIELVFTSGATDATGSMNPTNAFYDISFTLPSNTFEKNGYHFAGWTNAEETLFYADGALVTDNFASTGGAVSLGAKWGPNDYNVNFFAGEGATGTMDKLPATYDDEAQLTANAFFKYGYSFWGWTNSLEGVDGAFYLDGAEFLNLTDTTNDYALTALWTGNVYEVRFEPGEGGSGLMDPITMTYGVPKALPPNEFQRVDYMFNGWLTNGVTSVVYVDKAEVISLATGGVFTLTADWRLAGNTYSVDYHANNGTSAIEHEVYACSVETNLLGATKFSRSGYSFVYWTNNVGTAYQPNQTVVNLAQADETCDLYACWTNNVYGITFRVDGVETVTNAVYAKPFEFGTVAKTGYVFQGWTNAAQHVLIPAGESNYDFIGAQEFKAVFSPNAYRVTFNGSPATETAMEAMALAYDVETNLSANTFALEGRSFVCWTNTTDNKTYEDEALVSNLVATAGDTYALAAVWSNNVYTISFDECGGSEVTNITVEYASLIELPVSTKPGYSFVKWVDADGIAFTATTMPAGGVALFAEWTLVLVDDDDVSGSDPVGSDGMSYDGYIVNEQGVVGTYTLKVSKTTTGKAKAVMTVTRAGHGNKVTLTGTVDANTGYGEGVLEGLYVAADSVTGTFMSSPFEDCTVQGTANVVKSRDSDKRDVAAEFDKRVYAVAFTNDASDVMSCAVTFSAKGKAKIAGQFPDGQKFASTAQLSVGQTVCALPFQWAKNDRTVSFVVWFENDGSFVDVTDVSAGWDLCAGGSAGLAEAGCTYEFSIVDEEGLIGLLPDRIQETPMTVSDVLWTGKKFDAGNAPVVKYQQDEVVIDDENGTKKNLSCLSLKYAKGTVSGSFTVYSTEQKGSKVKLVKTKFSVFGVAVDGTVFGSAYNKKLSDAISVRLAPLSHPTE